MKTGTVKLLSEDSPFPSDSYCVLRRKNALLIQIGVEIVWDNID